MNTIQPTGEKLLDSKTFYKRPVSSILHSSKA